MSSVVIIGFAEIDSATFRRRLSAAIMANPAISLCLGMTPGDILAATRATASNDVGAELHAIAASLGGELWPEIDLIDDDPPWKGVRAPSVVVIDVTRPAEKLLPFNHGARPAGA